MENSQNSPIFNSEERTAFFNKHSFPFFDASAEVDGNEITYPYALYTCHEHSPTFVDDMNAGTILVAHVFDTVLNRMKTWSQEEFFRWGFPKEYQELFELASDSHFCLRVGWGLDPAGNWRVLEINSQTPAFWIEPEYGNPLLSEEFGLKNPHPHSLAHLKSALNKSITDSLKTLPNAPSRPRIGFVTSDYYEDIDNIKWLARWCDFPYEIVTIDNLDFTSEYNQPYNRATGSLFDCLLLWYPLEWMTEDAFANGDSVISVVKESLKTGRFSLAHAVPAFFIQPKSILAYITEHAEDLFVGELAPARNYFLQTYLELPSNWQDYFVKPLWGREGRGCYIVRDGKPAVYGRYQEEYYSEQQMVYQELMSLPELQVTDKKFSLQYESWAYRTPEGLKPGGIGIRATEHLITDDYSYWLPMGMKP